MPSDNYFDNSDVEFLDAVNNGPLAPLFNFLQPQVAASMNVDDDDDEDEESMTESTNSNNATGQSSTQQNRADSNATIASQQAAASRRRTRSETRQNRDAAGRMPTMPATGQSLAEVLHEFMQGGAFGQSFNAEGSAVGHGASGSSPSGSIASANRGLINIDFPLPLFLHSNPGDYAWGNAGFDAVITQLLNNLDGSNSGPPPMPKDQVRNLPTVKISDDQVKSTNLQCTVCMDDFQVGDSARQLPCEHFFHQDCIIPWLELHASCPICRKTFVTGGGPNAASAAANASSQHNTSDTLSETTTTSNDTSRTSDQTSASSAAATHGSATTTTTPTSRTGATTTGPGPSYDYTEDDCD